MCVEVLVCHVFHRLSLNREGYSTAIPDEALSSDDERPSVGLKWSKISEVNRVNIVYLTSCIIIV